MRFDPQAFHVDEAAAERSHFGALCASGWHTASVWMRLMVEQGFQEESEASAKWDRARLSSTQLCEYFLGYTEMADLAARYPGYGFEAHKGYATAVHLEALARLGPTPVHRRSFAPVTRAATAVSSPRFASS